MLCICSDQGRTAKCRHRYFSKTILGIDSEYTVFDVTILMEDNEDKGNDDNEYFFLLLPPHLEYLTETIKASISTFALNVLSEKKQIMQAQIQ